VEQLP
jgi:hypothetical protein